jgi:hypothetical protein
LWRRRRRRRRRRGSYLINGVLIGKLSLRDKFQELSDP